MTEIGRRGFIKSATAVGIGLVTPNLFAQFNVSQEFLSRVDQYAEVFQYAIKPGTYSKADLIYLSSDGKEGLQFNVERLTGVGTLIVTHTALQDDVEQKKQNPDGSFTPYRKILGADSKEPLRLTRNFKGKTEILEDADLDGKVDRYYDPENGQPAGISVEKLPFNIRNDLQKRYESGIRGLTQSLDKAVKKYIK